MQKHSMDFPPELEKFGGVQHVLHKNADRRLRRDDYRRTEQEKIGAFTPLVVLRIQGGALRQDTVVQDPSHPMLPPTAGYNPLTRESGGGCVVEDTGARILMQEEQMGMLGFTQHAISQLANQPAAQVQRVLAASSCVSTRALMFVAWSPYTRNGRCSRYGLNFEQAHTMQPHSKSREQRLPSVGVRRLLA